MGIKTKPPRTAVCFARLVGINFLIFVTAMTYKVFQYAWDELQASDKIACFNEYAREYNSDDEIFDFDDDFFDMFYEGRPAEAVRAAFFGNISNWGDEYIRFNGYGNLVSMSEYEAAEWADDYVQDIYEHEEIWSQYIDADDYVDDEDDDAE